MKVFTKIREMRIFSSLSVRLASIVTASRYLLSISENRRGLQSCFRSFRAISLQLLFCAVSVVILPNSADAALSLIIGDNILAPNMPNQEVTVQVQNTGSPVAIIAVQANVQVEDGDEATLAPTISEFEILSGTIFATDNGSYTPQIDTSRRREYSLFDDGALPNPEIPVGLSKFATVTIDTTGYSSGTYSLSFETGAGVSAYIDPLADPLPFTGSLTGNLIIAAHAPEPSTAGLLMLAGIGLVFRRRRSAGGAQMP